MTLQGKSFCKDKTEYFVEILMLWNRLNKVIYNEKDG